MNYGTIGDFKAIVGPFFITAPFLRCANIGKSLAGAANYVTVRFGSSCPKLLAANDR